MADTAATRRNDQTARLETLVSKAARLRGLRGLSEEELLEFGRLYRRAAAQLSHSRAYGLDSAELAYLNSLVGRAYGLLYVAEGGGWGGVGRFYRSELPQALRRHGRLIGVAAAVFGGAAILGALLALAWPDALELAAPGVSDTLREMAARHRGGRDWMPAELRPVMSSFIMTNNIKVAFIAFATGILLCLPDLAVLLQNGLFLGVIAAGVSRTDAGLQFWSFVAPHGVIELPAITIAAAAGLLLGLAIIEPGELRRVDALRAAGREAVVLLMGVVSFLVVAGLIEGFFSPAVLPPQLKLAVAAVLGGLFLTYALRAGR